MRDQPMMRDAFKVLEGDDYERDLRKRRGGLKSHRKEDREQIEQIKAALLAGGYDDEQTQAILYRNPGVRTELTGVAQLAKRRRDISSKYFDPGKPEVPFETTEEQEFGLPSLNDQNAAKGYRPNIAEEAVAPKADVRGAMLAAMQSGDFDLATKLSSTNPQSRDPIEGITIVRKKDGTLARAGYNKRAGKDEIIPTEGEFEYQQPFSMAQATLPNGEVVMQPVSKFSPQSLSTGKNVYDTQTEKLSNDIGKSNIPRMDASFEALDNLIGKHGKDLPGSGYLKNTPVATLFLTPEGQAVRAHIARIFNTELRDQSGAAVTIPEATRKQMELAMSAAHSSEDFINAYNTILKPWYESVRGNIIGGYNPKAVNLYEQRGGTKLNKPSKSQQKRLRYNPNTGEFN